MPPDQGPVVLVVEQASSFQTQLAAGLSAALQPHGIPLLVQLWGEDTDRAPSTLVRVLERASPRAIVCNPLTRGNAQERLTELLALHPGLPQLHVCGRGDGASVRSDNVLGMQLVAGHLVRDCRARRVLVVRGIPLHPDSREREDAVLAELARLGRPVDAERVVTGAFDRDVTQRAVREALERDPAIDAVVAFNDRSALGAIDAVVTAGKRVPEDVAVTGFDDEDFAAFCEPALTTVSQNLYQLAFRAGELLLRMLDGEEVGEVRSPVRLVVRRSTGCDPVAPVPENTRAEMLWGQVAALDVGLAMSRRFMVCETVEDIVTELSTNLPVLGITRGFLVLREDGQAASGSLVMAFHDGRRQDTAPEPFAMDDLLPEHLREHLRRGTLTIQPLEVDGSEIGYFILEQPLRRVSYTAEVLRMDLSRTIDTIRRTARLSERTRQLELEVASRRAAQQALVYQARHDALTGLSSRDAFLDAADGLLAAGDGRAAMLLVDLDRFKDVNDTLGHAVGDELLRQVATRLTARFGSEGSVCRLGGDGFAVFAPGVAGPEEGMFLAREALDTLREQYLLDGLTLEIEASVGVALAPDHTTDAGTLLRMADLAMYSAKSERAGAALYVPEEHLQTPRRLALFGELRRALQENELVVHYQPVVDVAAGRVSGVEALVRWAHPERGLLPPSEFVEIAEQTGLIHNLTTYVLDHALRDCRRWLDMGLHLVVAVNLSARRLMDVNLPDEVAQQLADHGLPASQLVLEVTETAAMSDPGRALAVLRRLRDLGVQLSVDDFGTGHASLAYLSRLPVSALKIDRSFVMTMETDRANLTIVRSTLDLARNLGLGVIAEGVETERAYQVLTSFGCAQAQGYWLARPGPAENIPAVIDELEARLARIPPLLAPVLPLALSGSGVPPAVAIPAPRPAPDQVAPPVEPAPVGPAPVEPAS